MQPVGGQQQIKIPSPHRWMPEVIGAVFSACGPSECLRKRTDTDAGFQPGAMERGGSRPQAGASSFSEG